jgi:uncharacterized protein YggE
MPTATDHPDTAAPNAVPPRRPPNPLAWLTAVVAILVVVVIGVAGVAFGRSTTAASGTAGTITVTGTGLVKGRPDTVTFTIGVDTVRVNAVDALHANNSQLAAIEALLRTQGVPAKDMQTSNLSIYQQTNSSGTVTGFDVNDTLTVSVHNVGRAGAIIDAAAQLAGNGINFGGVTFSISNDSNLLALARRHAMQSAMTEASQLAAGAGRHVTGIVRVTDQESAQQQPPIPFLYAASDSTALRVPLQGGSEPVQVQVTVVYTLST